MKIEDLVVEPVRVLIPDEILDPEPNWDRKQLMLPTLMSDFKWFDRNGRQYMFIGTPDGKIEKVPVGGFSTRQLEGGVS